MNKIRNKLQNITDIWNHLYLSEPYFQKEIRFTEEVKSNYYGDILQYFLDTLINIESYQENLDSFQDDFNQSIFNIIGLLQIFYVQQDLLDEILYIFKMDQSSGEEKRTIRELRNELVGHPIRKKPNLLSTVFWGKELSSTNIHYIKYSKEDNFKNGKDCYYNVEKLIKTHISYLNSHLDLILDKQKKIFNTYRKKLRGIENLIHLNNPNVHSNITNMVLNLTPTFYSSSYFTKEHFLKCLNLKNPQAKHLFYMKQFINEVEKMLIERFDFLERTIELKQEKLHKVDYPVIGINIKIVPVSDLEPEIKNNNYRYFFTKLYEKKQLFTAGIMAKDFSDSSEIIDELTSLESNMDNDFNYYTSLIYAESLIKEELKKDKKQ